MVDFFRKNYCFIRFYCFLTLPLFIPFSTGSQEPEYNFYYRVYFTDKGNYTPASFQASQILSHRSIERRSKMGINFPDYHDLPVYSEYISHVKSLGLTLHSTSKWMNTALFKSINYFEISNIENLPFVNKVLLVKKPGIKNIKQDKLEIKTETDYFPAYDNPLSMINGITVHNSGFDGTGMLIAVLDGGFFRANTISSLAKLRARNGIKGTRDIILKSEKVYSYHNHGTAVLSVLAGDIPGYIRGSAPGADYWLFRTEDVSSEFPVEEDYWVAAAEFADSIGADIISSSLGYCTFDDPSMNYKFTDMNGYNAFITRAADIAASKGILVVASAGNERNKTWIRIIAPSDGFNVICAGAVDAYNNISTFSSAGPSADGRIKPDNVVQGVEVTVQIYDTAFTKASGTSFSCPVLSGMCACIMQAVPSASPADITEALHKCGDRASQPDSLYGYGLPDMKAVIDTLQSILVYRADQEIIAGPNPFTSFIDFYFRQPPGFLKVEIFTITGYPVYRKSYNNYISRTIRINELKIMTQGIYFVRLTTDKGTSVYRILKLKN
ncbi:MAG: S8 family serine peptidase [Bacteroidales bacterium]